VLSVSGALLLSRGELEQLTGYRQAARQVKWLRARLKITPPLRADGLPIVSRAQVEAGLSGAPDAGAAGPKWRKMAP
jgi:Domain of unknown function (DUF4224)